MTPKAKMKEKTNPDQKARKKAHIPKARPKVRSLIGSIKKDKITKAPDFQIQALSKQVPTQHSGLLPKR